MKTPRDILLARHRAAEPKLDMIRETVLANTKAAPAPAQMVKDKSYFGAFAIGLTLWRELILPNRRVWSGLAAAWILIAMAHLAQSGISSGAVVNTTAQPEIAAHFIEQQKLLGELLTDRSPAMDIDRPKVFSPKPHTEVTEYQMV